MFVELSAAISTTERMIRPAEIWQIFNDVATNYEPKQWIGLCRRLARDPAHADELAKLALTAWHHDLQIPHLHTDDVLRRMAQHYKLGIIANQWQGIADRLKQHGWLEHFSVIVGSAEAGVSKPDPRIFRMALDQAKCAPSDAVMVGDRIDNDIAPANALGMATIRLMQGSSAWQQPRNDREQPTATVMGIADVPALFDLT